MRRRWLWIGLAAAALAAIAAAVYFVTSTTSVKELAELASHKGEKQLRESLREPSQGPRVLIFAFDGVGNNDFQRAVRSGQAPRIQSLMGAPVGAGLFEHAYAAPDPLSILPSTTMAAWSSIYTGEPAARTGVPGNEWFVREEMRFFAPAPVSVVESDHTVRMLTDGLVGDSIHVPTLYDLVDRRSYVSLAPVHRGADLFTTPKPSTIAELVAEIAKGIAAETTVSQEAYGEIDQESVDALIEAIERHGLPALQVVYFPGIDLFSHVADDPLRKQEAYLQQVLDVAIGRVLDTYERLGALDETYIFFIADHGHTPVLNDDRHSLAADGGDDEPPALIEGLGFRMRPFALEPDEDEQDYQAAVAYQGAMAYVYLADRSTCPDEGDRCEWKLPPRLEEDVMPVVRAFHKVNETGEPIPQLKATLDLIFAREPRPVDQDAMPFKVFDGEKLVPIGDYLKRHPRPDLLRLEERLAGLAAGPFGHRAGDILLLARSGLDRPIEDRFYFSSLYRSWHGSPQSQDSHVPLILARKNDSGQRLRQIVDKIVGDSPSQLHVVSLVRAVMGQQ